MSSLFVFFRHALAVPFVGMALPLLLLPVNAPAADANGVLREVYSNIDGGSVSDLTGHPSFPNSPSSEEILTNGFEAPTDVAENYGQRLRALLVPPSTGDYVFWVASDDGGALFLSTDESPAQKQLIASVPGWTSSRQWDRYPEQQSDPVRLNAGERYYIEALMKEAGGGDNLAVRWRLPNGTIEEPIPNSRLLVYGLTAPVIIDEPTDVLVAEGEPAAFSVIVDRPFSVSYQWWKDGAEIPGATESAYRVESAALIDSGSKFQCVVVNAQGTATTRSATLSVTPDTSPPWLVTASNLGDPTRITIQFSEPVEEASATDLGNYLISDGIMVKGAGFAGDTRTIVLTISPLEPDFTYTVSVDNVRDRATTPNTIAGDAHLTFSFSYTPLDSVLLPGGSEPPGPSSRATPLAITEIMYHPRNPEGKNLEFIELYNSEVVPVDLTGFRISGEVSFAFQDGTILAPDGYLVIAAAPSDVRTHYGINNVVGPFSGSLANSSGSVRLRNAFGAALLQVEYSDEPPWPASADGAGHSLVLARPSHGEADAEAWAASDIVGGSPGRAETAGNNPYRSIVINEFLAHTDDPVLDFIELYNYNNQSVDLSGCFLSDNRSIEKFTIPAGTVIPARGLIVFDQDELGFALSTRGEAIYLRNPSGTRVIDSVSFPAQENGVSTGRTPDGAPRFHVLDEPTPGARNNPRRIPRVVINELMYQPNSRDDNDEYVELYNNTAQAVDLSGWRFTDGITFAFPEGATIAPGGYVVVARNVERFRESHPAVSQSITYGNFSGQLSNSGERVALSQRSYTTVMNSAGQPVQEVIYTPVSEVTYKDGGRWGLWADGDGSSLELIDPRADTDLPSNWADSDESAKSSWTDIEHTGVLDHGQGAINELHVLLLGGGECLVDNLEVVPQGTSANHVPNSTFESGMDGWISQGNHIHSGLSGPAAGYESARALHLRASSGGDNGANNVETDLSSSLSAGSTATIRGKARWLKGHPELLLRLHGNHLEAVGQLDLPRNLGTPAQRNSRARESAGPAIHNVAHSPVLPAAGQTVTVRAHVDSPYGLSRLVLNFRIDPATNYTSVSMEYRGAGAYTASIPGQSSGTLAAFFIEATDAAESGASTLFPLQGPAGEALVRFGDPIPNSRFGTYRLWLTDATVREWSTRQKLSNETLDGTFVYGNSRAIYNARGRYRGSPFIRPGYNSPVGNLCAYVIDLPKDDLFLGEDKLNLDSLEPGKDDTSQREKMSFWIAEQLNIPSSRLRYIQLYVNGVRRSDIYSDSQRPDSKFVRRWYPDDDRGDLYKIDDWFEFNDAITREFNVDARLENYTTAGGVKKQARYRWSWEKKPNRGLNDDYQRLFDLVDAVNTPGTDTYTTAVEQLVDVEEWMRIFAVRHIVGDWDGYGYNRGKNMFTYKPGWSGWQMFLWDLDFSLGGSSDGPASNLFSSNDPTISRMYNHPPFRRAYLRALHDAAYGPLTASRFGAAADANYNGLRANGINAAAPSSIKDWVNQRRDYILSELASAAAPLAVTSNNGNDFTVSQGNLLSLEGTAPVEVKTITVNGVPYPAQWTGVTTWIIRLPLSSGVNSLALQGLDSSGLPLANTADSINVTFTGAEAAPEDHLVINEIMYHPKTGGAEFVEIHNSSATHSFDLTGHRLAGIDFDFAPGAIIAPREFLVIAKNRAAFAAAYGASIPVSGEFPGQLQHGGESLRLVRLTESSHDQVITEVTYSSLPPWPATPNGEGPSLQLIDPAQANTRVGNWGATAGSIDTGEPRTVLRMDSSWRYNDSGTDLGANWRLPDYNDASWPAGPGLLYVENSALPAPKNTELTHGYTTYYFRSRFTNDFAPGTPVTLALNTIVDDGVILYLNGQEIIRVGMPDGAVTSSTFAARTIGEASLEAFELPGDALLDGLNVLAAEVHQVNAGSSDVVFGASLELRPAIRGPFTPGAPNSVRQNLPDFPSLWISEIQPRNITGPLDGAGEREPWIELFNAGTAAIDLSDMHLSDDYSNLRRWAFPSGAAIQPGEYRLVWLDSHSSQTTASEWHTSFRADPDSGAIVLSRNLNSGPVVIDYLEYRSVPDDRSYGRFPDGEGGDLFYFNVSTPGTPNTLATGPVAIFINEWMAANSSIQDPADGGFDDWFELYNAGDSPVDLTGFTLTDTTNRPALFVIPPGTIIPAGGFLLVWADDQSEQNSPGSSLHVNFKLSRDGENIALYAPDGTLVDLVTFTGQAENVSEGRSTDGAPIPFVRFNEASPGRSNSSTSEPVFDLSALEPNPNGGLTLSWQSENGRLYLIQWKNDLGDAAWTDLEEIPGNGGAVSFTDTSGVQSRHRFYRLLVRP